jgi:hypothetical protein
VRGHGQRQHEGQGADALGGGDAAVTSHGGGL